MEYLLKTSDKRNLTAVSAAAVIVLIAAFALYITKTYEVKIDNKYLGAVRTKGVVQDILKEVQKKAEIRYGTPILVTSQVSCKSLFFRSRKIVSEDMMQKRIEKDVELSSQAFAINVDGENIAFLKDRPSAEEVLNKIKAPYIKNEKDGANIGFLEKVSIVESIAPVNELKGTEEVFNNIFLKSDHVKKYTVEEGDTVSGIAARFGLKVKDIEKANPDVSIDSISIGQELNMMMPRYAINVKRVTYKTNEEKIPFNVEYENDKSLYKGDSKVKIEGIEGRKLVKSELVNINGILDDIRVVSENVLKSPKKEVLLRGTKVRPRTVATGRFSMPSRGILFSRFGGRSDGRHTGIDIAAPRGTPNRAADGGVVIFAGRSGNYGKLVIIDHENGYTTYYAHNDTIRVRKGQRVAKGDIIGTAGTTGRTTGPHLHFEVRKNGVPVNPINYLR